MVIKEIFTHNLENNLMKTLCIAYIVEGQCQFSFNMLSGGHFGRSLGVLSSSPIPGSLMALGQSFSHSGSQFPISKQRGLKASDLNRLS